MGVLDNPVTAGRLQRLALLTDFGNPETLTMSIGVVIFFLCVACIAYWVLCNGTFLCDYYRIRTRGIDSRVADRTTFAAKKRRRQ